MKILFKIKLLIIALSLFIYGHAPWGQHEVYRQMHMLLMCSKTDTGAFEFTKTLTALLDDYLPEANARVARARDGERLTNLLITNQIPLAVVSTSFLDDLQEKNLKSFNELLKNSNTIYTFKSMSLISNHTFPEEYISSITEALLEASEENHDFVKFYKREDLIINYNDAVFKNFEF